MNQTISSATLANWKRLGIENKQMVSRANKTDSIKKIFPKNYAQKKETETKINKIINFVQDNHLDVSQFILSLASFSIIKEKKISKENKKKFLSEVENITSFYSLEQIEQTKFLRVDLDEPDFLGTLYQTALSEGARNKNGLFYTPYYVADKVIDSLSINKNIDFLDSSVGTGIFLIELATKYNVPINKLHGFDTDSVAAQLAKANLLLKANISNKSYPDIKTTDYLFNNPTSSYQCIVGNPPWGAKKIKSAFGSQFEKADSFAFFLEKGINELSSGGELSFVLPISFLNVATHEKIRNFVLKTTSIKSITFLPNLFEGVFSDVIILHVKKDDSVKNNIIKFFKLNSKVETNQKILLNNIHNNLLPTSTEDNKIRDIFRKIGKYTLNGSTWALGIVTGNNKKYKLSYPTETSEPLITGKEISSYCISDIQNFIEYNRNNFQQVAPDEVYRAPEKLLYKFISKDMVFAYDNQKRLPLNSANVLIPKVKTHSVKTILAFLNSTLFKYIYRISFNSPKILRGDLEKMKFPELSKEQRKNLEILVNQQLQGGNVQNKIDDFIFNLYGLNTQYIERIKKVLKTDVFS